MSTAVAENPRSQRVESTQSEHHLSFFGILRSEFLKFRSLTSSWVLMIVTVALMGLLAMAMAALGVSTHLSAIRKAGARPLLLALILFGWLLVGGAFINHWVPVLLG